MDSTTAQTNLSGRRALVAAALLVTLAAIGNSVVTALLSNSRNDFASSFACGMLIAQPCLLSIWCALVKQKLILRISFSMGILFGLYCLYMLTLANMEQQMPLEIPLVCFGIIAVLTVLIQTPLFAIRRVKGYALSTGNEALSESDSQFGIKHLMIATTIVAVLMAIAQASLSQLDVEAGGNAQWGELFGFLFTIMALVILVVWLCLGFVFFHRGRVLIGILLAGVTLIGPSAAFAVLSRVSRSFANIRVWHNSLAFSIALTGTMLTVLFIFHAIGYRAHRVDK